MVLSLINCVELILQCYAHTKTMMRWYEENPLPHKRGARAIRVGLAVDDNSDQNDQRSGQ